MKKLVVGKNEIAAEVVEKIIDEPDSDITIVIPKNSVFGESVSNFHLLKREADGLGKKIVVESVDDGVLALARASRIGEFHPLFDSEKRVSSLSDIIPRSPKKKTERNDAAERVGKSGGVKLVVTGGREEGAPAARASRSKTSAPPVSVHAQKSAVEEEARIKTAEAGRPPKRKRFAHGKLLVGIAGAIVAVAIVVFVVGRFFSRATISISFSRASWTYEHSFTADTSVSKVDADKSLLPAEFFTAHKDLVQLFPASGSSTVSEKAAGKITIYNGYSSQPQKLVAMTRFASPEGKIFRLSGQIIVPGAQIANGKIIPASIDAGLVADKPGSDYNIGPVSRLVIPGFKGTPKYDGFYGEIKEQLQGGFVGKKAVPTADDITKAKSKAADILKTSLQSSFLTSYPRDFKILDGTSNLNVTKLKVDENTDANGNFSVLGEADLEALGFRESDLKSLLLTLAKRDNPIDIFAVLKLDYGAAQADFKRRSETFYLSASGTVVPEFSADDFSAKIIGKPLSEVKSLVSNLPGLMSAKVSLWPIWLNSLPLEPGKIKIEVN